MYIARHFPLANRISNARTSCLSTRKTIWQSWLIARQTFRLLLIESTSPIRWSNWCTCTVVVVPAIPLVETVDYRDEQTYCSQLNGNALSFSDVEKKKLTLAEVSSEYASRGRGSFDRCAYHFYQKHVGNEEPA